jgi:hypothetical protein
MEFPIVAGLILSLVVRYWPGQPAPQWINTWTDRLWLLLAITFLVGSVPSLYNVTNTALSGGGYRYSVSRPALIQYALVAFYVPLVILALVGAGHIVRAAVGAVPLARAKDAWVGVNFFKLGASLAVAAGALAIGFLLGGPLIVTSSEGVSNLWPFAIEIVAAVVFFTALASAWSAAKAKQ